MKDVRVVNAREQARDHNQLMMQPWTRTVGQGARGSKEGVKKVEGGGGRGAEEEE